MKNDQRIHSDQKTQIHNLAEGFGEKTRRRPPGKDPNLTLREKRVFLELQFESFPGGAASFFLEPSARLVDLRF